MLTGLRARCAHAGSLLLIRKVKWLLAGEGRMERGLRKKEELEEGENRFSYRYDSECR